MKINENRISKEPINGEVKLSGKAVDMDSLINKVKVEDAKNLRITKSFQWVYIVLIVIYTGLLIFDPFIKSIDRIIGAFYIASFIAFILIFRKGYKEYKSIDYTLPVIEMLRETANRYRLRVGKLLTLIIPILLMDVGVTLRFYNDLLPMSPLNRVLIVQAIYIPVFAVSALIGILIWRKKQKPLRDRALELIEELESV
jgi:hypothetical protein